MKSRAGAQEGDHHGYLGLPRALFIGIFLDFHYSLWRVRLVVTDYLAAVS